MIIQGVDMPGYTEESFPDSTLYAEPELLKRIQLFSDRLGSRFNISPVNGALARFDVRLTSEHRVIIGEIGKIKKKSTAIDGFPEGDIFKAWLIAQDCDLFSGIGVYFDTFFNGKPAPLLHLDLRKKPLLWYRHEGIYHYPHEQDFYLNLLGGLYSWSVAADY